MWTSVSPCVVALQMLRMTGHLLSIAVNGQGLTLVHFSAQPEPFLS